MSSGLLSPVFGSGVQLFTDAGLVLAGGFITVYVAGTTTKTPTYTDPTMITQNSNPLVLDAYGRLLTQIFLDPNVTYKFVVTDSGGNPIGVSYDNVVGISPPVTTSQSTNQWIATGLTPTYISTTQFSVAGDQTAVFPIGTRTKSVVTSNTIYSTVTAVSYASSTTTVTVGNDSGTLNSGLSAVSVGILSASTRSIDAYAVAYTPALTYPAATVGYYIQNATWVPSGLTATYVSATTFTFVGDQTATCVAGRRVKFTLNTGSFYGTIVTATYGAPNTTVVLVADSTGLDNTLSAVYLGAPLLASTNIDSGQITWNQTITYGTGSLGRKVSKLRGLETASVTTGAFVAADAGKCVYATGGVTVPNATMSAEDSVVIINTTASPITITATITTLRQAGTTNTGNRTLAAYGIATIAFVSGTLAFISGTGLT